MMCVGLVQTAVVALLLLASPAFLRADEAQVCTREIPRSKLKALIGACIAESGLAAFTNLMSCLNFCS